MSSALRPVVTFLNHGILPFVGREGETGRILDFWRETMAEPVLRALLVSAEAGMGKSRMAEEIIRRVEQQGAAVVHIRFYPDSSLSLAPLLSQSLGPAFERQQLPPGEADRSSNITLLRRLAFLRPTMILIEDLHLLGGNPLRELQEMLLALRDLPVSVVLLTRPIEIPVRGVVEPWLVDEIHLGGLDPADLTRLLNELFGMKTAEAIGEILHRVTLGNPLAIRSALRAAVTSEALVHAADGSWQVKLDRLVDAIERGVHLLTEGMVAHLSVEERQSAELLAELGEVFARQTARGLIDAADQTIDTLLFRGVLSQLDLPVSPLVGTQGDADLIVFSHTLLHRSLLSPGALPGEKIIGPIAAGLPFYSTHAIEQLERNPGELTDPDIILAAIDRLLDAAAHLDGTADWQVSPRLLDAADALAAHHGSLWDSDTRRRIEFDLLHLRISTMRRDDMSAEFGRMADRFLEATAEPLPAGLRRYRIQALKQKHLHQFRHNQLSLAESWEQIESIIRLHPELRSTRYYINYLRLIVTWGVVRSDYAMARIVEDRFAEIEAAGILDEELHRFARMEIHSNLLAVVSTPEELERRLEFLAEIDASPRTIDNSLANNKIRLLLHIGRIDEVLPVIEEWLPRFEALGLPRSAPQYRIMATVEPLAFGADLHSVARRMREIAAAAPEQVRDGLRELILVSLAGKGMLRGEMSLAEEFAREFHRPGDNVMEYELRLLIALARGGESDIEPLLSDDERDCASRLLLRQLYGAGSASLDMIIDRVREELAWPIIGTYDLLTTHALLLLVERLRESDDGSLEQALRPAIRNALEVALGWLEERGMWAYMLPLLQRYKGWLTRRETESWQACAHRIARERKDRQDESTGGSALRIRMLGTIEAHEPDGTIIPVRGGRLRLLLGLLVADRMLARPLGHREFCRIAGGDDDPERARKTVNGAVMRLRETLGEKVITTDGETPSLDLALVDVDLLDALRLMREAAEAMRGRLLARALSSVREALDIWSGAVPFPTLYQSFFEAAREDFESGIRSTTMTIARALLAEDDPAGAENLLRRATAILPGDNEIAQLLIATLERSGRKTDAERMRLAGEIDG